MLHRNPAALRVLTTKIRLQRFPAVVLEAALLPSKGLATTQSFAKGDTIATFVKQDHRLRLLLSQYRKLPFPTATACLVPFLCHCGATHLRLQAMDDMPANTILLLGEPQEWQGCLVQFDGSAHKNTQTGGQELACYTSRRPPLPLSSGFPPPCFLVLTMS